MIRISYIMRSIIAQLGLAVKGALLTKNTESLARWLHVARQPWAPSVKRAIMVASPRDDHEVHSACRLGHLSPSLSQNEAERADIALRHGARTFWSLPRCVLQ